MHLLRTFSWDQLRSTIARFPLAFLSSALCTGLLIWIAESEYGISPAWADQAIPSLFIGILMFGGLALFAERLRLRSWLIQLMGIPLLYLLVFRSGLNIWTDLDIVRLGMVFVASLGLVFAGAYVKNTKEEQGFWNFAMLTLSRALVSIAVALIFVLGFNLAVVSIQELFSVNIGYTWPQNIAYFFCIFVASLIFYSGIPEDYKELQKEVVAERAVRTLAVYISFPLLITYFLIVAAYVVKILVTQNWPDGFVAMPVLLFTLLGFATYALVYPIREGKNSSLIARFARVFPWVALPFLLVYFVALWKRIEPYGLTEMRVLGVLLGLLLTSWAIYYGTQKKASLRWMPLSVFVFGLLFSFGPWSPSALSLASQMGRIETLLEDNGLLVDDQLVTGVDAPEEVDTELSNKVDFVVWHYGTKPFEKWLGSGVNGMDTESVVAALGATYAPYYGYDNGYTYSSFWVDTAEPAQVAGYDYAVTYYGSVSQDYPFVDTNFVLPNGQGELTVSLVPNGLKFAFNGQTYEVPLLDFMENLEANGTRDGTSSREELSITVNQGKFRAKIFFNSIGWTSLEPGDVSYDMDADLYFSVK